MGYERFFKLGATSWGPTEVEKLKTYLASDDETYNYCFNEWVKWYDFVEDLKRLSKLFSNVLFYCAYVGELEKDNEYVIIFNGQSVPPTQEVTRFKIPLNETVMKLMAELKDTQRELERLYDEEDDDKSEIEDIIFKKATELEDKIDALRKERMLLVTKLLMKFRLVDISSYF
jgi:hypothetical protein